MAGMVDSGVFFEFPPIFSYFCVPFTGDGMVPVVMIEIIKR
jgi:hypothetical protein